MNTESPPEFFSEKVMCKMSRPPADVRDEAGHLLRELHGVTLVKILEYLVGRLGFAALADRIPIKCFALDPSLASSLVFLRRTPWARKRVEELYIELRTEDLAPSAK